MHPNSQVSSHQMKQILKLAAQKQVDQDYRLDDIVQAGEEAGIPQPLIQEAAASVLKQQQDCQGKALRRLSQKQAPMTSGEIEANQERKDKVIALSAVSAFVVATLASAYFGYTKVSVAFWDRSEFRKEYKAKVQLPLEQAANAYTTATARQGVETALVALNEAKAYQYPEIFPDFERLKGLALALQNDDLYYELDPTLRSRLNQLKERLNEQTQSVWGTALAYGVLTIIFYAFLPTLIGLACLKCWQFFGSLKNDAGLQD